MLYSTATTPSASSLCPLWDRCTLLNYLPMPRGKGLSNARGPALRCQSISVAPTCAEPGPDQIYSKKATSQRSGYSDAALH